MEHESKDVDLLVDLDFQPHLWSGAVDTDWKNEITDGGAQSRMATSSHQKETSEVVWSSD